MATVEVPRKTGLGLLLFAFTTAAVLVVASRANLPVYALWGAAGSVLLLALVIRAGRSRDFVFYSPTNITAAYLFASVSIVPVSWALGLAAPWPEVVGREGRAVLYGVAMFGALFAGVVLAGRAPREPRELVASRPGSRRRLLVMSIAVSWVSLGLVLASVGGVGSALQNLAYRREFFAGLGPVLAFSYTSGLAWALTLPRSPSVRPAPVLSAVAVGTFLFSVLLTGQKGYLLALILVAAISYARRRLPRREAVLLLALILVPASTWYQYNIRQRLSLGHAEGVIATESSQAFVQSTWGPFARSGLDQLRTMSVILDSDPKLVDTRFSLLANGTLTLVPRSIVPAKPDGPSLQFAKTFFPAEWEQGTGIPPSLPAELVMEFGLLGAVVGSVAFGYGARRLERILVHRSGVAGFFAYSILVSAFLFTIKAGTDSGLRDFVQFFLPAMLVARMARGLGFRVAEPS